MFLLFWLILLTSGARKQSRNRPAFRLPLSRAVKARREPNGSNVFSISYGRRTTKSVSETVSGTVSERSRRQFWSADISGRQNSRSFPVPIYRESKSRAVFPCRYIGKAKVAQFFHPDISGRQKSRSFPVPIYWETKTHAIFCHEPLTGTAGMPLGTITGGKDRNR